MVETAEPVAKPTMVMTEQLARPTALAAQTQAIRTILSNAAVPVGVVDVAAAFVGRKTKKRLGSIESILETLVALGQAEVEDEGHFSVV